MPAYCCILNYLHYPLHPIVHFTPLYWLLNMSGPGPLPRIPLPRTHTAAQNIEANDG